MKELFTERHRLREPKMRTNYIDDESYTILYDCCERYKDNLAWKFPEHCSDFPNLVCGLNENAFRLVIDKAIPGFCFGHPSIEDHFINEAILDGWTINPYLILDYIEFIASGIKTMKKNDYHSFMSHYHLSFANDNVDFESFRTEINDLFEMCGLLYNLTKERIVERVVEDDVIIEESKAVIEAAPEQELKKLIEESVKLHKSRNSDDCHLATEKIWDALERLKTIFVDDKTDKKASVNKIIGEMAKGDVDYSDVFCAEFVYLTSIGNNFRIRHHEFGKKNIPNNDYYDYFFSRCFSLIVLALKSLK